MTPYLSRSASSWFLTRLVGRRPSLSYAIAVARQRRDLARLDDAALKDIGVTPGAARRESRRGFWDLPR